jgi:choline dehydrogenase-like flavoprotein
VFVDARGVPAGTALEVDVCVIGGGAAGITLARRFSRGSTRVAILESGGFEPDAATQSLYEGPQTGIPYFPLNVSRLRYFGGTTGHWGGTCRPMEAADFEARPGVPRSGWPIGRADLDRYYGPAAELLGIPGTRWGLAPWEEESRFAPFDLGGRVETRVGRLVKKRDRNLGTIYREDVRRAANVKTYLQANVTEIETDEGGRRVRRLHVATLAGNRFTVRARSYVLAAGGIENARLLLLSDRHHRDGLGNEHGNVGRFFAEHPRFKAGVLVPADRALEARFYRTHRVGEADIEGYLALPAARQREEGLVDVQIGLRPVYEGRYQGIEESEDVEAVKSLTGESSGGGLAEDVRNVVGDLMTWRSVTVPGSPLPVPYPEVAGELLGSAADRRSALPQVLGDIAAYAYTKLVGTAPLESLEVVTRIASAPDPDSRVTLVRDRDRLGLRRAKLNWSLSPIDRRSVVRSLELLGGAAGATGLGRVQALVRKDDREWPDDIAGGFHHVGTTRMSDSPRDGVVDRDCRVHGVANLYVAGSSVFPTVGSGTPTLTLVALAMRLGDHLERGAA